MTQRVVNYTYGTGNPVFPDGSIDVRDGIDNLQSMDVFMNAPEDEYNQRDGKVVSTVSGANRRFDAQILNMGFTRIGTFAAGATLTNPRQTLLWDIADGGDGQEYGWSGAFPKVVPAASTPASTGGISVGAWISRFDPELRIQVREAMRRSYAEAGYNLVDGSFEAGGTLVNASDVLLHEATGKAFSGPAGAVAAGTNPASGGFVDRSGELIGIDVGSISVKSFGVDTTGAAPADTQLLSALQFSANFGIELVITGAVRLTQTMVQPAQSIVRCDGYVFCDNPEGLTDSLLWTVAAAPSVSGTRTEIRSLTLGTSLDLGAPNSDKLMYGLRVSTPRVSVGIVKTYGLQLGGVEIGPTGYEVSLLEAHCICNKWAPTQRGATGVKLSTTDLHVGSIVTFGYPVGADVGSANHVNSVHVWGLPANGINQYPNQQLLTGLILGAAAAVDYVYIDSVDTEFYDTPASGSEGVGVVFLGWESSISSLNYKNHSQQKPGKTKMARFVGYSNYVDRLQKSSGPAFHAQPIVYDNDAALWRNRINASNDKAVNIVNLGTTILPTGVTSVQSDAIYTITKEGQSVTIYYYCKVLTVDTTSNPASIISLPLPPGLRLTISMGQFAQKTAVSAPPASSIPIPKISANGKNIEFKYHRVDTGQLLNFSQSQLITNGYIEFYITAVATEQM